jgi:hypothetical protein
VDEDSYVLLLTRIAVALEDLAAAAVAVKHELPSGIEATRPKRKSKSTTSATSVVATPSTDTPPSQPVDINDDKAMRQHAGERIRQLVAQAFEAGCTDEDIKEVLTDNAGSADLASQDLNVLSQVIVGLTHLIKSHDTPAEESETDKRTRAEAITQIHALTQRAAAKHNLALAIAVMQEHAGGDVDHLELGRLQALLAAMQAAVNGTGLAA